MRDESTRRANWFGYYTGKRIGQQWMQLHLLEKLPVRRVLEVGPAYGLVTAMLDNAGFDVTTLDRGPPGFERPKRPHLDIDLLALDAGAIRGFDAILCCETLEHLPWESAPDVLRGFAASGARHLIVSVPYEGFQFFLQLYLNRYGVERLSQFKKLRFRRDFAPDVDPTGHQWEIGYRGRSVAAWEAALEAAGWRIRARRFTSPCRSIFHLCENATPAR